MNRDQNVTSKYQNTVIKVNLETTQINFVVQKANK